MWASLRIARVLADRCTAAGLRATLVTRADAGHRTDFPNEVTPPPSTGFDRGGTPTADRMLGAAAWPYVLAVVREGLN